MYIESGKALQMQRKGQVRIMNEINLVDKPFEYLPIIIPFKPDKDIGGAYNKGMEFIKDWGVFMDYDILTLNPYWYNICLNAVNQVGKTAGWITCYTNRIGCPLQVAPGVDCENHDFLYHREFARNLYRQNKGSITDITMDAAKRPLSALWMLTNKTAWELAGKFEPGFFTIDNKYCKALIERGLHIYRMDDMYVYHGYWRESLTAYFEDKPQDGSVPA
jgi:hypothetical protein